jgi:peptidoglycan/LPS O-acetylase OafA/YrhL
VKQTSSGRYPLMDGLRGLAAIAVLLHHIGPLAGCIQLVPFGFLAVDLFFVMSGFVIALTYESRLGVNLSWRRFAILRIFRLYPVLALSVVLAVLIHPSVAGPDAAISAMRALFLVPDFSAAALFPINAVLWSLFYELLLNLGHAAAARRLTLTGVLVVTGICGGAYAFSIWYYHGAGLGWGGSTFIAGFARAGWGYGAGVALARTSLRPPAGWSWIILAGVLLLLFAPNFGFTALRVLMTVFVTFPLACVAAASVTEERENPLATWLGGLSYPLYGVHLPLINAVASTFGPMSIVQWLAVAAGITLFAALLELIYDAPLRRLFKRVLV